MRDKIYSCIIILIILIIFYMYYLRYTPFNTTAVKLCNDGPLGGESMCSYYNVHRHHKDQEEAAILLKEIMRRNKQLIDHLKQKYFSPELRDCIDPSKNNRIDVIKGSELCYKGVELYGYDPEYLTERVKQLMDLYKEGKIYEISPLNKTGSTSYTENKVTLILCLRHKEPDAHGEYQLHDINTIMFVVIHELTHMMNEKWGHKAQYWKLFKVILDNAVETGIYTPVDYRSHPIVYCGLEINYSPLYDPSL